LQIHSLSVLHAFINHKIDSSVCCAAFINGLASREIIYLKSLEEDEDETESVNFQRQLTVSLHLLLMHNTIVIFCDCVAQNLLDCAMILKYFEVLLRAMQSPLKRPVGEVLIYWIKVHFFIV
jgi:hypothetical protein